MSSKALLITGVDFSEVAVDQVTILEDKPCTAVSLNPSSLTFDTHEESKQLTAVKTPADTTDSVVWTSSNTNVATVSNSGLVTIHGIGTATITATCGSATALLTINQTSLKQQRAVIAEAGRYVERWSVDVPVVRTASNSGNSIVVQAFNEADTDLKILAANVPSSVYELIRVPYGATKAKIATNDSSSFSIYKTIIAKTAQMTTYNGADYPTYDRVVDSANTATGVDVAYGECVAFRLAGTDNVTKVSYVYFT